MLRQITLSPGSKNRLRVVITEDGVPVADHEFNPTDVRSQKAIAKQAGCTVADLIPLLARVRDTGEPVTATTAETVNRITIRSLRDTAGKRVEYPTIEAAFAAAGQPFVEPVIEWTDGEALAVLDVDYHKHPATSDPLPRVQPQPFAWHRSHGGGWKLYFRGEAGISATHFAACAALSWLAIDPSAGVEVKRESRHPAYPRGEQPAQSLHYADQTRDIDRLRSMLATEASSSIVAEWLEERGIEIGQRLPHDKCPIDPSHTSHGTPVYVGEAGIHCHACAAKGKGSSRRPGFRAWSSIVGGVSSAITTLVRHCVHWEHAKYVLQHETGLNDSLAKVCYEALLTLTHGKEDARVANVFKVNIPIVWLDGRWSTPDGTHNYTPSSQRIFSSLPAIQDRDGKPDGKQVEFIANPPRDLSSLGYTPLTLVRGVKVWGQFQEYATRSIPVVTLVQQTRDAGEWATPRYLAARDRVPDAWERVEAVLPDMPREYLKLLIVARGWAESASGMPPILIVDGPSASGKTATVHAAASICGDSVTDVPFTANEDRYRMAVREACQTSGFLLSNEIIKDAQRHKLTPREALDPLLNLTPDSRSHEMYKGPRPLGQLPAIVFTDVHCPQEVRDDTQIGRRSVHVRLTRRLTWEQTIHRNIGHPRNLRYHTPELSEACDAILSEVIDEFFTGVPLDFFAAAKKLGFSKLEHSDDFDDPVQSLVEFFDAVCTASDNRTAAQLRRWPGEGWRVITRTDATPLADAWRAVADPCWYDSRRVRERDWGALLGLEPGSVLAEIQVNGQSCIAVRFRDSKSARNKPRAVNGGLRK